MTASTAHKPTLAPKIKSKVDGFINLNKPQGITSNAALRLIKRGIRASGVSTPTKIGHVGTLDPIATGVLPICIGRATRFVEHLLLTDKEYVVTINFGYATDTYDVTGKPVSSAEYSHITALLIDEAVRRQVGEILQIPPMYSALKKDGVRLYELARRGDVVERSPRPVKIKAIKLLSCELPEVTISVTAGRGFYARSFAHDLGQQLNSAASMSALVRTRLGNFELANTHSIEDIEAFITNGSLGNLLMSPDFALPNIPRVKLDSVSSRMVAHGRNLPLSTVPSLPLPTTGALAWAYSETGVLLALLSANPQKAQWHSAKVLV